MAALGSLKSVRTKAFNALMKESEKTKDFLSQRYRMNGYTVEQFSDLEPDVEGHIEKLTGLLNKRQLACDNLRNYYTGKDDLAGVEALDKVEEDEYDLCDKITDSLPRLKHFLNEIKAQKNALEPKVAPKKEREGEGGFEDKVTQILAQLMVAQNKPEGPRRQAGQTQQTIKLPRMEIEKFGGDLMKWSGFWAQFRSAIHNNASLSNIDKFNYLKAYLSNDALETISGIHMSDANYTVAVDLLTERFGNNQLIIEAHYAELQNLSISSSSTVKLRAFYDAMEKCLRSLIALGQNIEHLSLVNQLKSKLPSDILFAMEREKGRNTAWTMPRFRELLKDDLVIRESLGQSSHIVNTIVHSPMTVDQFSKPSHKQTNDIKSYGNGTKPTTAGALFAGEHAAPFRPCIFCQQKHWSSDCDKYTTIEARKKQIKGKCFICLQTGHLAQKCVSKKPCFYCHDRGRHHQVFCPKKCPSEQPPTKPDHKPKGGKPNGGPKPKEEINSLSIETFSQIHNDSETGLLSTEQRVIMQTVMAKIENEKGTITQFVRGVMDSGSHRCYMAKSLADRLDLTLGEVSEISLWTFGAKKPQIVRSPTASVVLRFRNGQKMPVTVNIVPTIAGALQRFPFKLTNNDDMDDLLNDFVLADNRPTEADEAPIELLIDGDYYLDLILPKKVEIQPGLYVLGSRFGWILAGRVDNENGSAKQANEQQMLILNYGNHLQPESALFSNPDNSLPIEPNMKDFWDMQLIGINEPTQELEDKVAYEKFNETVQIKNDRFEVSWPWREAEPDLPENYLLAYNRFKSVTKRLENDSQLLEKYDKIIQEQVKLGIIEKVTSETEEGPLKHYIPHHPVVSTSSVHTKTRIVYDASAKSKKTNKSLNECLYRGQVLLRNLVGLLIRFRFHSIALVADIEKAFLNIGLRIADRDVTRFFWFQNPTNPKVDGNVQIYRFCRIPFGVISSPFLLAAAINYLMDKVGSLVSAQLKDDIYVDNVITGTASISEAIAFYNESQTIFKSVSLNLREWASNSEEFLSEIPPVHCAEGLVFKVLGITWNTKEDCLQITGASKQKFEFVTTKRQVLQMLASIYDPLGFFSPVTLKAKFFLHSLWAAKLNWDSKIPDDKITEWQEIATQLNSIAQHKIPQLIVDQTGSNLQFRLLCFCDASADSYATVVYVHVSGNGINSAHLLFSKTRLSPQKQLSIPRLELMAALVGRRSMDFVGEQLPFPIISKILWTDSQCVLHWIRSKKLLSVFVQNRVNQILESKDIEYRYVHTTDNPADMATRGKSVEELADSIWWHGPQWLQFDESEWPTHDVPIIDQKLLEDVESEIKGPKVLFEFGLSAGEGPPEVATNPLAIDPTKYSSLCKLFRVTAWWLRYLHKLRSRCQTNNRSAITVKSIVPFPVMDIEPLTASEIASAKLNWELAVQQQSFPAVIKAIKNGKRHNLCDQLGLKLDNNGLLRSHARYINAELTEAARQPKLLPKNNYFTTLVINDVHEKTIHSGVAQTLATIRQEYWITQGRSKVRLVLKQCRICRRVSGGPFQLPKMAPWPSLRVSQSAPFTHTGLDYFGPLYVKNVPDQSVKKVWVCLFTCTVVRAIHLELVEDMTTEQFLLCLRRFIARFGKPNKIISDNASQFKLANNTLAKLWSEVRHDPETLDYVAQQGIEWKFIVELAPWMGGFYERMVGLVKTSLKKAIGKLCLTQIQRQTILAEVQAVVNSRPLVYVGDDINSTVTLSPAHFLGQNQYTGVPVLDTEGVRDDPDYQENLSSREKLLETWKRGQTHLNRFWDIWSNEYLLSLRERTQHHITANRIQNAERANVGDVVLIKDDLPRGVWKIGKIQELLTSQDGQIRTAKVLLPSKRVLTRRLNMLCPIKCPANEAHSIQCAENTAQVIDVAAVNENNVNDTVPPVVSQASERAPEGRPRRAAFIQAQQNLRQMAEDQTFLAGECRELNRE